MPSKIVSCSPSVWSKITLIYNFVGRADPPTSKKRTFSYALVSKCTNLETKTAANHIQRGAGNNSWMQCVSTLRMLCVIHKIYFDYELIYFN